MTSRWRLVIIHLTLWCGVLAFFVFDPGSRGAGRSAPEARSTEGASGPGSPSERRADGFSLVEMETAEEGNGFRTLDLREGGEEDAEAVPIKFAEPNLPAPRQVTPDEAISRLLSKKVDLRNPQARRALVENVRRLEHRKYEEARARALALGIPITTPEGGILVGFVGDTPVYDVDENERAAISTGADQVRQVYGADGSGFTIGLWEAGNIAMASHNEFQGRVTVGHDQDATGGSAVLPAHDWHATHVAGTLVAAGSGIRVAGDGARRRRQIL